MFIIERFFGISIYILILGMICFLLVKTNISVKSALRLYLLLLCCIAFFYKPYQTADLYRIFEQMEYFSTLEFGLFWKEFVLNSSTPIARLLYWIFGKIGINELLPTFSGFFCYSIIFYIIDKTRQMYNISNQTIAVELFFIMTTSMYISVIGGIRMMIALSMINFSYFRMTIEKKFKLVDIIFFIASILIHSMSFAVMGIIAFTLLFDSEKNILKKLKYAVIIGLIGVVFVFKFSDTLRGLFEKFLTYILGEKHSDTWEYLMGTLIIIVLVVASLTFRRVRILDEHPELSYYNNAAVFSIILAIAFCFEFSMFYRFGGHLAVMFAIPTMMVSMERTKGESSFLLKGFDLKSIVILLSCIIAVISCTRGSLCSFKLFEL